MAKKKVLHVMEFGGRQTYIEIDEPSWKVLTANTEVKDGTASGWYVDRDLLSKMLVGTAEYLRIEQVGGWPEIKNVDYHIVFSNIDQPKQFKPWETFK